MNGIDKRKKITTMLPYLLKSNNLEAKRRGGRERVEEGGSLKIRVENAASNL